MHYKRQEVSNFDESYCPLSEMHHVKAAAQTPIVGGVTIASGSQSSGLGVGNVGGNRGLLLGSYNPHIPPTIDSFRGARVSEYFLFLLSFSLLPFLIVSSAGLWPFYTMLNIAKWPNFPTVLANSLSQSAFPLRYCKLDLASYVPICTT